MVEVFERTSVTYRRHQRTVTGKDFVELESLLGLCDYQIYPRALELLASMERSCGVQPEKYCRIEMFESSELD